MSHDCIDVLLMLSPYDETVFNDYLLLIPGASGAALPARYIWRPCQDPSSVASGVSWMSKRELRSLTKDSETVVTSRLRSSQSLETMEGELEAEVTRLKTLLDEAQAATLDKERQLAELEDVCERRLEEAEVTFAKKLEETEVTFERRRSEEVAAV